MKDARGIQDLRDDAADHEPHARHGRGDRLERRHDAGLVGGGVTAWTEVIRATHWTPLPTPPTAAAVQASRSPGATPMPR